METAFKGSKVSIDPRQGLLRFLKQNPLRGESGKTQDESKGNTQEKTRMGDQPPYTFRRPKPFDQMATDRIGEELSPQAAIWNIYLEEAQEYDEELVKGHQESLDTLLLFATLYSAILTAFLIESKSLLQQNPADMSTNLLLIIAQSQRRVELGLPIPESENKPIEFSSFQPSQSVKWVNRIWFTSLGLSLSVALITMLCKEWLNAYLAFRPRSPRELATIRQTLHKGLEDWWALYIIALLPTLLHVSLLLFSIGLVVSIWDVDVLAAAILAGVIGATLAFYITTVILGAVYEFCPFVTEVSKSTQRIALALFRHCGKKENHEHPNRFVEDLRSLLWLTNNSRDPVVVDCAYQAMSGLYRSAYLPPRENVPSQVAPAEIIRNGGLKSLLDTVSKRFDEILAGTLETGAAEPPVGRYIHSMVALASLAHASASNLCSISWFNILKEVTRLWDNPQPRLKLSANTLASVLVAEMDLIQRARNHLLDQPASDCGGSKGRNFNQHQPRSSWSKLSRYSSASKDLESSPVDSGYTFSEIQGYTSRWLDRALTLESTHIQGRVSIDSYLLDGLRKAMSQALVYHPDAATCPVTKPPTTASHSTLSPVATDWIADPLTRIPAENHLISLHALIEMLAPRPNVNKEGLVQALTGYLNMYSTLAPAKLRHALQIKANHDMTSFRLQVLAPGSNLLMSLTDISCVAVRYMMLTARYLHPMLPRTPQYSPFYNSVLELVCACTRLPDPDMFVGTPNPMEALGKHIGDFIYILETTGENRDLLQSMHPNTAHHLTIIANTKVGLELQSMCYYIPPSCIPTLLGILSISGVSAQVASELLQTILHRMRAEAPVDSTVPGLVSYQGIQYLHQFTQTDQGFSRLLQVGVESKYREPVLISITDILKLVANINQGSKTQGAGMGLGDKAVDGFLRAVSWALKRRLLKVGDHDAFVVAASKLVVEIAKEKRFKQRIFDYTERTILAQQLQARQNFTNLMITLEEQKGLIEGLQLNQGSSVNTGDEGPVRKAQRRTSITTEDGTDDGVLGRFGDEDDMDYLVADNGPDAQLGPGETEQGGTSDNGSIVSSDEETVSKRNIEDSCTDGIIPEEERDEGEGDVHNGGLMDGLGRLVIEDELTRATQTETQGPDSGVNLPPSEGTVVSETNLPGETPNSDRLYTYAVDIAVLGGTHPAIHQTEPTAPKRRKRAETRSKGEETNPSKGEELPQKQPTGPTLRKRTRHTSGTKPRVSKPVRHVCARGAHFGQISPDLGSVGSDTNIRDLASKWPAGTLLRSALERYLDACFGVESCCHEIGPTAISDRMAKELSLLDTFTEILNSAKATINFSSNHARHLPPMDRLPPEIIIRILRLATESGRGMCEKHKPPYFCNHIHFPPDVLASVCVRWRSLMLQCPTFWSRIDLIHLFHYDTGAVLTRNLARAKGWAERVNSRPLDIRVAVGSSLYSCDYKIDKTVQTEFLAYIASHSISSLSFIIPDLYEFKEDNILQTYLSNCVPGTLNKLVTEKSSGSSIIKPLGNVQQWEDSQSYVVIDLPHEYLEALWRPIKILRLHGLYFDWGSQAYHGLEELSLTYRSYAPTTIPESQLKMILASSPGLRVLRFGLAVVPTISVEATTPVHLADLQILDLDFTERTRDSLPHVLRLIAPGSKPFMLLLPRYCGLTIWADPVVQHSLEIQSFMMRTKVTELYLYTRNPVFDWIFSSVPHLRTLALWFDIPNIDEAQRDEIDSPPLHNTVNKLYILGSSLKTGAFCRWLSRCPPIRTLVFWKCLLDGGSIKDAGDLSRLLRLLNLESRVENIPGGPCPVNGWVAPPVGYES